MRILRQGDDVFVEVHVSRVGRDSNNHTRYIYVGEEELVELKERAPNREEFDLWAMITIGDTPSPRVTERVRAVVVDPGGTARLLLDSEGIHG